MDKKIVVYGMGYVGLSNAILLAQKNTVIGIDIVEDKINKLNKKESPIVDNYINDYLKNKDLDIQFKINDNDFINIADYAIIATPTNFDEEKNLFDTSSVECIVEKILNINPNLPVVIKSTVPIGFMSKINKKYQNAKLFFSPEFLREGQALYDNLFPSRIIVGYDKKAEELFEIASDFANLLKEGAIKKEIPLFIMNYTEAESVKLFSNTYLAMRVAYFNEIDDYAIKKNLNTSEIIDGMCADPRIGNFYNNPSFGYGGYCFPKDTKQLRANYCDVPNSLIDSIVESNNVRKNFIANSIIDKTLSSDVVGIYRLTMKSNSDNFRSAAIFDIIKLISKKRKILIYEPQAKNLSIEDCEFENDINKFKEKCNIIIANRVDDNINDVKDKIYTRDVFNRD